MGGPDLQQLTDCGLRWLPSGNAALSGPLYELFTACDAAFVMLADTWQAAGEEHPAMLDAADLQAINYLASFPHLATFPVCLDADATNLAKFAAEPLGASNAVRLTDTASVRQVLTPAACYHVYPRHRGERLTAACYLTIRNTCFRREAYYEPLRRQWSFRMREIVCLGTRAEVAEFLAAASKLVDALLRELGLSAPWAPATDPFFEPARNPQYLAQKVQPTKHEARYGGDLAIASVNMHEDHFGAAFGIERAGQPAASGCLAFGVERWLYAIADRYGVEMAGWPDVPAAARRAVMSLQPSSTAGPGVR